MNSAKPRRSASKAASKRPGVGAKPSKSAKRARRASANPTAALETTYRRLQREQVARDARQPQPDKPEHGQQPVQIGARR